MLKIRAELDLFSNLRPAILYPQLADASSLKKELVADLDLMIVRELTGGIYFGEPRGVRTLENGERQGYNTMVYSESEIERACGNEGDSLRLCGNLFSMGGFTAAHMSRPRCTNLSSGRWGRSHMG